MSHAIDNEQHASGPGESPEKIPEEGKKTTDERTEGKKEEHIADPPRFRPELREAAPSEPSGPPEPRPIERIKGTARTGLRGTAAMDPKTRQEVARKGGLAVSRNKAHMAEIGRKGGQSVSRNREHMAQIGRKGGAASRGHR